jgi:hypothetical protein
MERTNLMGNKVLIILGMHRSGTSLTAQWLYKCGLNIGDNLLAGNETNKDGHFEDLVFHDLHEEIFKTHNIPYGGFVNIEDFKPSAKEIESIKKVIDKKNNHHDQWGWKDPRTCLFINEYIRLIPNAQILILLRDYNQIINSLISRDMKPTIAAIKFKHGRLGKLRLLKYTLLEGRNEKKRLGRKYSKALITYYKNILNVIKQSNNVICLHFDRLIEDEKFVIASLEDLGFEFGHTISIKNIINTDYITATRKSKYVYDRKILMELQKKIDNLKPINKSLRNSNNKR